MRPLSGSTVLGQERPEDDARARARRPGASTERLPVAVWCLLIGLAFNIFSGFSSRMGLPVGPDRLLLAAAVLLVVLSPGPPRLRMHAPHWAMALLALIGILSAWTHGNLLETNAMFALLDRLIVPFVLFATAPALLATPLRRRRLLQTLTLVGAYLSVVTFLEAARLYPLILPRYIPAVKIERLTEYPEEIQRAGGPFVSGEPNGMALAMCGFAAFALARLVQGRWRTLAAIVAPLCLVATVLSMTRSVWLGVAIGVVGVVASTRSLWRWVPAMIGGCVVLATAAALAFPTVVADITERGGTSRSLWDRQNTNAAAVAIMEDHPLTGIGWQQFAKEGRYWVSQDEDRPLTNVDIEVHNVFLSRGAELGVPALVLFCLALLTGPVAVLGHRRRGEPEVWRMLVLACFSVWLVVCLTSPNSYPFPALVLWTITGYAHARLVSGTPGLQDAPVLSPQESPCR